MSRRCQIQPLFFLLIFFLAFLPAWRAGRTADAKRMFLKIENSKELYYTGTIFHSAGNTYEYGSFTSNYKNEACIFLTKIFIEERNYTAALAYLIKADKKYKIRYNCGTGQNSYMGELKNLYALCYEGLGLFDKSIDLHFSEIFYGDSKLIRLLKNKYNSNDLRRWLKSAKGNIILTKNTSPTIVYTTDEQTNEMKEVRRYTSGTASTVLFGRKVILPSPPDLENGQTVSRQDFIKEFIESDFYHSLYYGK